MANDLRQQLARVKVKSDMLLGRYKALAQQKADVERRVEELEKELERMRREEKALKQQLEFMRVAATIDPSRENVAQSRVILSEIIREIDTCIEQLKY